MKQQPKPITAATGERWHVEFVRGDGYTLYADGNSRGTFDRMVEALEAKDAYFTEQAARAQVETVVAVTAEPTDDLYAITPVAGARYELTYRGELVDTFYCYGDAEDARLLHAATIEGETAGQPSARRCIHCGDPVTFGDVCAACVEDAGSAVLAA